MRLLVPPLDLVRRYSEVVRSLHASVVLNREMATDLGALRDTLLPRLISGQLRLKVAEEAVAEALHAD
jgi:type I restriction enzyme S subunit